ncbi:MAG: hypothetical protein CW338_01810 [Clostridiales bacterium]|nr:hypothetical protein [Clostridiales bacterium]
MRITHPITPYQGFQPEDVFFVSDDRMMQLGTGYVIRFEQPSMYPERPIHYYISIEAQPQARSMLFGALLARVEQMQAKNPGIPARMYASVPADNEEMARFYEDCGLISDDAEDMVRFELVPGEQRAPMGMLYGSVPLETSMHIDEFLNRVNYNCIQKFNQDYLTLWRQQPHFMALGYFHGKLPVCETVITGAGESAMLLHIYTLKDYRRQHMAEQLIGAASGILAGQGVKYMYAHVYRRNAPQAHLMEKLHATYVKTVTLLPGMNL